MKIADLASCLAPGIKQKIAGIRPGEKLHEIMVPAEKSRMTLEQADRVIIQPTFKWWIKDDYITNRAKPVKEDFAYSSDNSDEFLDTNSLAQLLERSPHERT